MICCTFHSAFQAFFFLIPFLIVAMGRVDISLCFLSVFASGFPLFSTLNFMIPTDSQFLPILCLSVYFYFSQSYYLSVSLVSMNAGPAYSCWFHVRHKSLTQGPRIENLSPAPCSGRDCLCVWHSEYCTFLHQQSLLLFWSNKCRNEISEKSHD